MLSPLDTGVLVQRPSVTEDSADDVDAPLSESNEQSILSGNRLWGVGLRLGDGVRSRQRIVEVICIEWLASTIRVAQCFDRNEVIWNDVDVNPRA